MHYGVKIWVKLGEGSSDFYSQYSQPYFTSPESLCKILSKLNQNIAAVGVHGLRRRSRRIGCRCHHRCASWWEYSPILEWQILEQLSHGQAPRLLVGWVDFELTYGLRVYAEEPRLLHLRTAWLLPGSMTSSLSGLVSQCWEWMAASRTFSRSPWGNLYNAWQGHTADGYQLQVVHKIPASGCDRLACA